MIWPWQRRRKRPMSADWCAECMVDLPQGKVYEVRNDHQEYAEGPGGEVAGGTYWAATYCRKHAPKGAIRA